MGENLKEAQAINKSLSALGDVISALATEQPHIPYRNHKLTMLMSGALTARMPQTAFDTGFALRQPVLQPQAHHAHVTFICVLCYALALRATQAVLCAQRGTSCAVCMHRMPCCLYALHAALSAYIYTQPSREAACV